MGLEGQLHYSDHSGSYSHRSNPFHTNLSYFFMTHFNIISNFNLGLTSF
jgi:hypothetical protein